jgi:HTH-type transcriptional regulator/antitoxin HigA
MRLRKHFTDHVDLCKYLLWEHRLKAKDLCEILGVSKGMVSGMLNHKKGFPKRHVKILCEHFKIEIVLVITRKGPR